MADDNKIQVELIIDEKSIKQSFSKVEDQADSSSKKINKSMEKAFTADDALGELAPTIKNTFDRIKGFITSPVGIAAGAFTALGLAAKGAFDIIVAGEKEIKIEKTFAVIAANAGLVGSELASGLEKASQGLITSEDLLQSANKAIVELGSSASKLPQILELARKVAITTGQDTLTVFEDLNRSILTGNTRALAQYGIVIDSEKVQNLYANSLGKTKEELTKVGQQEAVLGELLKRNSENYKDINTNVKDLGESQKLLTTQVSELFSEYAKSFSKSNVAENFRSITKSLAEFTSGLVENAKAANEPAARLEDITTKIKNLQLQQLAYMKAGGFQVNIDANDRVIAQLEKTKLGIEEEISTRNNLDTTAAMNAENEKNRMSLAFNDLANYKKNLYDIKNIQPFTAASVGIRDLETLGVTLDTFSAAFLEKARLMKTTMGELADVALKGLGNAFTQGFAAVGKALVKGGNALQAFGEAFIGAIGSMLIQSGSAFILEGLALSFLGDPRGPGLLGVGTAMTILGGALSASGGGGETQSASAGSGGGVASAPSPSLDVAPEEGLKSPQTQVQVVVNGDVFDTESTGLRIIDILNSAFDQQGVVVRGAV